jgi:hypothetical protein
MSKGAQNLSPTRNANTPPNVIANAARFNKQFLEDEMRMMAEIGKRTGVAILYGRIRLHGFVAWWLWRMYYLSILPTVKKKLTVMVDWTIDFLFKPDVSMIKRTDLTIDTSLGDKAIYRVEESLKIRSSIVDALHTIIGTV